MKKRKLNYILFIATIGFLFGCDSYATSSKKRFKFASSGESEHINIAIVDSSNLQGAFLDGVKLAIKEVNESNFYNKKIHAEYYDDEGSIEKGRAIARKLATKHETIAVIGHQDSNTAIASSIIYEASGILFISPGATQGDLIKQENNHILRNIPSDKEFTVESAKFSVRNKYNNMVIIYDRDDSTKRYAELFQKYATDFGINIIAVKSYSNWEEDYRQMIGELIKGTEFDAILLSGKLPSAGNFIKQLRSLEVNVPILTGPYLDSIKLWKFIGEKPGEVIVPTTFNPELPGHKTRHFVNEFMHEYKSSPDTAAAQGYDAINLLATSIKQSQSYIPITLSRAIKLLKDWKGSTGSYSFKNNGDIEPKSIFFKQVEGDKFIYLEANLRNYAINPFDTRIEKGRLRIAVSSESISLDPALINNSISAEINEQLFLGLTNVNPDNYSIIPELATSWTVSEDGKIYIFNLRKDVKWTSGESVTANDIVFAINRNINRQLKAPNVDLLFFLKNAKKAFDGRLGPNEKIGVESIDDYTVKFTLNEKIIDFPAIVSNWIYKPLPEKAITKYQEKWTEIPNIQTNGPFFPVLWKKGLAYVLKKNNTFYESKEVSIKEIRFQVINDIKVGLAMFKNNQLDIMGGNFLPFSSNILKTIKSDKELSPYYKIGPKLSTYGLLYNTKLAPLDNIDVRKAISSAINRVLITKLVVKGEQKSSKLFSPEIFIKNKIPPDNIGIDYDPFKATKLLEKAGFAEGVGFPTLTLEYNHTEDKNIAIAIQKSLKHILNIDIYLLFKNNSSPNLQSNSHLLLAFKNEIYFSPGYVIWEFFDPDYTGLISYSEKLKLKTIFKGVDDIYSNEKRISHFQNAENIISTELCLGTAIYNGLSHYLIGSRISGWNHKAIGGQKILYWNISN